jgi:hypothetical protein
MRTAMRARTGRPFRVAGEKTTRSTCRRAVSTKGSLPETRDARATVPSSAINSSRTTSALPCAEVGYGTSIGCLGAGATDLRGVGVVRPCTASDRKQDRDSEKCRASHQHEQAKRPQSRPTSDSGCYSNPSPLRERFRGRARPSRCCTTPARSSCRCPDTRHPRRRQNALNKRAPAGNTSLRTRRP